jgi:hypothetical protein
MLTWEKKKKKKILEVTIGDGVEVLIISAGPITPSDKLNNDNDNHNVEDDEPEHESKKQYQKKNEMKWKRKIVNTSWMR